MRRTRASRPENHGCPSKPRKRRKRWTSSKGQTASCRYYKDMIAYRKNSPALARGKTTFINLPEPLLAFTRHDDDETLTCIFNLSKDTHEVPMKAPAEIALGQAASISGDTLTLEGNGFAYLTHGAKVPL